MNQVTHQQVNQQLNIASVGSGTVGKLKTFDDCGNNLEMPLICYLPEEWAQLSSTQKSSICKHQAQTGGDGHDHGGKHKHQQTNVGSKATP